MVLFIISLLCYRLFSADTTPHWLGIVSGTTMLAALISGAICIAAAIFGRFKSSGRIVESHEKDAAQHSVNADWAGQFALPVSGWRQSLIAWLNFWPLRHISSCQS